VEHAEAVELIRAGVTAGGGVWADLGAGAGRFTRALAQLLGPAGEVHAVDIDPAVRHLAAPAGADSARVAAHVMDIQRALDLPRLEGALAANAFHFVADPVAVARRVRALLRPHGRLVVVEYDVTARSPWVPEPLPFARLERLAGEAGFGAAEVVGRRPSRFGGRTLYAAVLVRSE
jgi:SAM-dependent methyltransferase